MKKLIPLLLAVFALTACEKNADTDKLDNKFVVYTNYDKSANFKQFSTYYLPDSILIIGDKDTKEYWKDANAQKSLTPTYSIWTIEATLVLLNAQKPTSAYNSVTSRTRMYLPTMAIRNGGGGIRAIGMFLIGVTGEAAGTIRIP